MKINCMPTISDNPEIKKKVVTKGSSIQLSSDTDNQDDSQDSSESIKPNAIYEIVQAVRKETQLSHDMSKVAVETVLISLRVRNLLYIMLSVHSCKYWSCLNVDFLSCSVKKFMMAIHFFTDV